MLKLLLLLLVVELLNPGLSDLEVGIVTVAALFVTHESEPGPPFFVVPAVAAKLLSEFDVLCWGRFMSVGRRDGTGDPGDCGTGSLFVAIVVVVVTVVLSGRGVGFDDVFRVVVPCASRGILLGSPPMTFTAFDGLAATGTTFLAALVVDRVTRDGRCSEAGATRALPVADLAGTRLAIFGGGLATGVVGIGGNTSSSSSSSHSEAVRFANGVLRG